LSSWKRALPHPNQAKRQWRPQLQWWSQLTFPPCGSLLIAPSGEANAGSVVARPVNEPGRTPAEVLSIASPAPSLQLLPCLRPCQPALLSAPRFGHRWAELCTGLLQRRQSLKRFHPTQRRWACHMGEGARTKSITIHPALDRGDDCWVYTCNGYDWVNRFSMIAGAFDIEGQAIVDGEVVVSLDAPIVWSNQAANYVRWASGVPFRGDS
jgi:hypothetical protein